MSGRDPNMKKMLVCAILLIGLVAPFTRAQAASSGFVDMMQAHPAVMLLVDAYTGEIKSVNEAAIQYYGYSAEEFAAMNISEINALPSTGPQAEFSRSNGVAQLTHRLKNGSIRSVEITAGIVTVDSRLMNMLIVQDVTQKMQLLENERKQTKTLIIFGTGIALLLFLLTLRIALSRRELSKIAAMLEKSNALMRRFNDADESHLYLKDENFRYVFANKAAYKIFGRPESEIVGKEDFELFDEAFARSRRLVDMNVLKTKATAVEEVPINGNLFRITKFPVELLNGATGVGCYATDITQERIYERKRAFMLWRSEVALHVINNSTQSMHEQLTFVLQQMIDFTGSKFGYVYLYDEKARSLSLSTLAQSKESGMPPLCQEVALEEIGILGNAITGRRPVILNNFMEAAGDCCGGLTRKATIKTYMGFPVILDGTVVATVGLFNREGMFEEDEADELVLLMDSVWNAMQRRQALATLSFERNKYLQTLISIGDGVMVVNAEGTIEMLNGVAERLTGWSNGEAKGRHYKEVFVLSHEQPGFTIKDPIEDALRTSEVQELGNHAMLTSRSGTVYYLEDSAAPIRNEHETVVGVVLVFRDVTDKKEQRKRIEFLSFHDSLTGLYNRRYFEEEIQRVESAGMLPVSIILGDVNSLKLTNDIFGHAFGDMLLEKVSEVLRSAFGSQDVIARWGGDEFVILMPGAASEQAEAAIHAVQQAFSKEQIRAVRGSISMGYATKFSLDEPMNRVLTTAEENMYSAKSLNRDVVRTRAIDAITSTLYESSQREKEHSERVSELSVKLGRALGLSEGKLKKLKEVARLHDIGKIVLEPNILNKNHLLTMEEWNEVKRHPIIGYRILNSFDDTVDLAESVLAHHEQWDGTGYPKGLRGEEIPLLARIIAVVESYERMTHDSDNTKARTREGALKELRDNAGRQFDPMLAELFARMIEEGEAV